MITRLEEEKDYKEVEILTREAFWNIYKPGCNEHLVIHNLRKSNNFIQELDFVVVDNDKIVGNIVYSLVYIVNDNGEKKVAITFGPISVHPNFQKSGIGKRLIEITILKAKELSYKAIFITGSPDYYNRFGFEPASKYDVHLQGIPKTETAPFFMALELETGFLNTCNGICEFDSCFETSTKELEAFELEFSAKEKREPRATDL